MRFFFYCLPLLLVLFISACDNNYSDISQSVHLDKKTQTCLSQQGEMLPEYFCTSTCENPVKKNNKPVVWINCFTQKNPEEFLYKNIPFDGIAIMLDENLSDDIKYTETTMKKGIVQIFSSFNSQDVKTDESFFENGNETEFYSYYSNGKTRAQIKIQEDGKEFTQIYYINEKIAREYSSINKKITEMKIYDTEGNYQGTFSLKDSKKFPSIATENQKIEER